MKSVPFILTALLLLTVLMGCETSTGPIENDISSGKGVNNTDACPDGAYPPQEPPPEFNFEDYCGGTADGNTIGFWKNNIRKAIQGRENGIQVDAETLQEYIEGISVFDLPPFEDLDDFEDAYDVLNSNSNDPVDLLAKQLLASEFNYMNEAYIDGDMMWTYDFIYYGEYIIVHAGDFTDEEILYAKDWYDAYNNSHGGQFYGPGCDD